ncbi:MAG: hypothetical protein KJ727_04945 [Acidobacteria bacterium]|nr:hypothetical protein [Acidobacteriota bacterium]MBU4253926.1 hypothetical protein [Acidobacteriota bacterium]
MELKHVALVSRSEKDADIFFEELLGLTKEIPKILPAELSGAIFDIDAELKVINYAGDGMRFEIFITDIRSPEVRPAAHVCLQVSDPPAFLQRCGELGIQVLRFPKGDKVITFVTDKTGNLFEIK